MLDIRIIREQTDLVRHSIAMRHLDPDKTNLDRLISLDDMWRKEQGRVDELRGKRNEISSSIKDLAGESRQTAVERVKEIKKELSELESHLETLKEERDLLLKRMPNLLAEDTPIGHTDEDNLEISRWGEVKALPFKPRDHVELGSITDTIDFDRAGKVAGSNFYYLKNEAALLELALCQYASGQLVPRGFYPYLNSRYGPRRNPGGHWLCSSRPGDAGL